MKRIVTLILVCCVAVTSFAQQNYFPNELIVMLEHKHDVTKMLDEINAQYPNAKVKVKKPLAKVINVWLLEFDDGAIGSEDALRVVNAHNSVALAQFNHTDVVSRATPNDPEFSDQWDMFNDSLNGSGGYADISALAAWDISTGGLTGYGDTIVCAVIDGDFDMNHEDLNWWKNYDEIPGDSVDNDGNGYIDDFDGWNAYDSDGNLNGGSGNHGTHVSGTVGAIGNNGTGVAGVNWNVKVMPVRGSSGFQSTVVEAYGFVLAQRREYNQTGGAQGAYVVSTNSSFGIDEGLPSQNPIWCAFYDSLGAEGVLSMGATANQNWDIDVKSDVPTACPSNYMVAVTNTDQFDNRNNGAAYGLTTIDLGAPGTDIKSSNRNNNYGFSTGTSMATPHVCGAIGLMYAAACTDIYDDYAVNPQGLADEFRNLLLNQGVDAVNDLNGMTVTGGRLNLQKCAEAAAGYGSCIVGINENVIGGSLDMRKVFPNPANRWISLEYDMPQSTYLKIEVRNSVGQLVSTLDKGLTTGGIHSHRVDLSNLPGGVYLINLNTGVDISKAFRVVLL